MIRTLPFVIVLMLAVAFLAGWLIPDLPEQPSGVSRGRGAGVGLTLRPGESTAGATRFLRTLRSDPAPPPPPVVVPPPPPPPPPPPDVSVVFKAALSAIERDPVSGSLRALVRNTAPVGPQIIAMIPGDHFRDGWRITLISAESVTLEKGREVRIVRLYS